MSSGKKRSAEEADIEVEYNGPECLRGVQLVPVDSVDKLYNWKNCRSVEEVHSRNRCEHPELLVRIQNVGHCDRCI